MLTYSDAVLNELSALIKERMKTISENVTSGLAIHTMEQYRDNVGRHAGLSEALQFIDEARENVDKKR